METNHFKSQPRLSVVGQSSTWKYGWKTSHVGWMVNDGKKPPTLVDHNLTQCLILYASINHIWKTKPFHSNDSTVIEKIRSLGPK